MKVIARKNYLQENRRLLVQIMFLNPNWGTEFAFEYK